MSSPTPAQLLSDVVLFRTYSRLNEAQKRETWQQICDRVISGLAQWGQFLEPEIRLMKRSLDNFQVFSGGRSLWVAGTQWSRHPKNVPGFYNCCSLNIASWEDIALTMDFSMMGCGVGILVLEQNLSRLEAIVRSLKVTILSLPGETPAPQRKEDSTLSFVGGSDVATIEVGDSRRGWVDSLLFLLRLASNSQEQSKELEVQIHLRNVRPQGTPLKGFGGIANPSSLSGLYPKVARILNQAVGRRLTSVEVCLLVDEAALVVVAGGIRRSAGIRQGDFDDAEFSSAKQNLWRQNSEGEWFVDVERAAMQMANHTRVCLNRIPSVAECVAAVKQQVATGEGAIQYAPEAIARASADLLPTRELKNQFIGAFLNGEGADFLLARAVAQKKQNFILEDYKERLNRFGLNPCVTADTWIHTEEGARQVKDLIGKQTSLFVNGNLFSTTKEGFWFTGTKPVFKVKTEAGYELRLTENHKLLKVTAQTQKKQYREWVQLKDLRVGDLIMVQDHRDIQSWDGQGTFDEGWLVGSLIGDGRGNPLRFPQHGNAPDPKGSIAKTEWNGVHESLVENQGTTPHDTAILRYWGDEAEEMLYSATESLKKAVGCQHDRKMGYYNTTLKHHAVNSTKLAALANSFGVTRDNKMPTSKIEEASYEFYRGFLQGFFDADGSVQGNLNKGVSIRLSQSNLESLKIVQRMLARLGVVSKVYENRRRARTKLLPDSTARLFKAREPRQISRSNRKLAPYHCKSEEDTSSGVSPDVYDVRHELIISKENICVFQELVGFRDRKKAQKAKDLVSSYKRTFNRERYSVKISEIAFCGEESVFDCTVPGVSQFDANGIVAHNCGEIIGNNFFCNLSEIHLNRQDPLNLKEQTEAFEAGALFAAVLLHQKFDSPKLQASREADPIIGVSFTGLFDFFVQLFGKPWLEWWAQGRDRNFELDEEYLMGYTMLLAPVAHELDLNLGNFSNAAELFLAVEQAYLSFWRRVTFQKVAQYCDRNDLKIPNRCTTVQPAGTKSLLTGASCGWHPPKFKRYLRRITFEKNHPVALAAIALGYKVIPSQFSVDESGKNLDDIYSPLCSGWLLEIPIEVSWASIAEDIDLEFPALAQIDFYFQVQKHYTTHNTSATFEVSAAEAEAVGHRLHRAIVDNEGYVSAAILGRSEGNLNFPNLPYEPISLERYYQELEQIKARATDSRPFATILNEIQSGWGANEGPAPCDSDKCLLP